MKHKVLEWAAWLFAMFHDFFYLGIFVLLQRFGWIKHKASVEDRITAIETHLSMKSE